MHCPRCNIPVGDSDRFCTSCGTALTLTGASAPGTLAAVRASAPGLDFMDGPSTLELASQVGARRSRGGTILLLLVYILLFGGAAWGTFTYLASRSAEDQTTLTLGTPRLVRGGDEPGKAPAARAPSSTQRPRGTNRKKVARAPRGQGGKPASGDLKAGGAPAPTPTPDPGAPPPAADDHDPTREAASAPPDDPPAAKPAPAKKPASPAENMENFRASLNAESMRMVIKHYLPQLRVCYERASKKGAFGGGVVDIQFAVSSEGKVSRAQVIRNSTGSRDLGTCIANAFKRWRFPRPVGGEVEFIYPFVFASGG